MLLLAVNESCALGQNIIPTAKECYSLDWITVSKFG